MGQPTLDAAFKAAVALIGTMKAALKVRQVITANEVLGRYDTDWGGHADLVAINNVTLVLWPGMIIRQRLDAQMPVVDRPLSRGTPAGKLNIVMGDQHADVPLITAGPLDPPGTLWRLTRINF
jgi:hypothetical protein